MLNSKTRDMTVQLYVGSIPALASSDNLISIKIGIELYDYHHVSCMFYYFSTLESLLCMIFKYINLLTFYS